MKYVISIMDPPPETPLKFNLWADLVPKSEAEFPKENRLRIVMPDSKKSCAIEYFPGKLTDPLSSLQKIVG